MIKKILPYIILLSTIIFISGIANSQNSSDDASQKIKPLIDSVKLYLNILPEKSLNYAKEALSLSKKLEYKSGEAISSRYVGTCYEDLNKYDNALKFYLKSLKLYQELDKTERIAQAYNNIANIYYSISEYDTALSYYNRSLNLYKKIGNNYGIALTGSNIGTIYLKNKNYKRALDNFNKSLNLYHKTNDKWNIAYTINNIGLVYIESGQYDSALVYFNKSLEIKRKRPDLYKKGIANTLVNIGRYYLAKEDCNSARQYFIEGLELANSIGAKEVMMESYQYLSELYAAKKDTLNSLKYYRLYSEINNDILNRNVINKIAVKQFQYETEMKEKEIEILKRKNTIQKYIRNTVIAVFVLVVILLGVFFRIYKNRAKTKEQLAIAKQKELETKMQLLFSEQKALTSQMNPHFIFNSLAAIQSLILQQDLEKAEKYLTKFSKLMRNILHNSMLKTIPLINQLNNIELYVELEKMRYGNKFEYQMEIDASIDTEEIEIPPMLLQPYVENSILHGLGPKKENGLLRLSIKKAEDNVLLCTIEDNGIGRKKSKDITEKRKNHQSVGMKNSEERIRLLNQLHDKNMSVTISDLDATKEDTGTKVELYVPFQL